MKRFAICNMDGSIDSVFSGDQSLSQLQCSNSQVAKAIPDNLNDATAYWDSASNTIKAKAEFPVTLDKAQIAADGTESATISGIPSGASLTWPDGKTDIITDGIAQFSVDLVGTYKLTLEAVAYLRKEVTIEAVAPA